MSTFAFKFLVDSVKIALSNIVDYHIGTKYRNDPYLFFLGNNFNKVARFVHNSRVESEVKKRRRRGKIVSPCDRFGMKRSSKPKQNEWPLISTVCRQSNEETCLFINCTIKIVKLFHFNSIEYNWTYSKQQFFFLFSQQNEKGKNAKEMRLMISVAHEISIVYFCDQIGKTVQIIGEKNLSLRPYLSLSFSFSLTHGRLDLHLNLFQCDSIDTIDNKRIEPERFQ